MSYVTNYILSFSICEEETPETELEIEADIQYVPVVALNKLLDVDQQGDFECIDKYAGGNKSMEAMVYGYAANYYSPKRLMKAVVDIKWALPEEVQLFVKDQEDDIFAVYNLKQMEEKCHSKD